VRCSKPCDPFARDPAHDVRAALRLVGGKQGRVLGVPAFMPRRDCYTSDVERVLTAGSSKYGRVAQGHRGHHVCQGVFVSRGWRQYIGYARTCIGIVTVVVVTVTAVFIFAIIAVTVAIIARGGGSLRRNDTHGNNRRIASERTILRTMHRGNGRQDTVCHRPSQLPRPCAGPLRPMRIRWRRDVPVLSGERAVPRRESCVALSRVLGI